MGDFRITVNAVGGHGCEREKKDGETVYGCGRQDCPDCLTSKFVADLARTGCMLKDARIEHWPDSAGEVVDNFDVSATQPAPAYVVRVKRTRKGAFP